MFELRPRLLIGRIELMELPEVTAIVFSSGFEFHQFDLVEGRVKDLEAGLIVCRVLIRKTELERKALSVLQSSIPVPMVVVVESLQRSEAVELVGHGLQVMEVVHKPVHSEQTEGVSAVWCQQLTLWQVVYVQKRTLDAETFLGENLGL